MFTFKDVTDDIDNTVSVIDAKTNTLVKTVSAGSSPYGVAVNPKTNVVYVANKDDSTISLLIQTHT